MKPSVDVVNKYLTVFKEDHRSFQNDTAINKLIKAFPYNTKIDEVLLKATTINSLYATNIFAIYKMAEHIVNIDIDELLLKGNPEAVNRIARGHGIANDRVFYSFATKYCSWHQQDKFPLYDSNADKTLRLFRKQHNFAKFKNIDLKNYEFYRKIINEFRDFYELNEFNYKELDKFLWGYHNKLYYKKVILY